MDDGCRAAQCVRPRYEKFFRSVLVDVNNAIVVVVDVDRIDDTIIVCVRVPEQRILDERRGVAAVGQEEWIGGQVQRCCRAVAIVDIEAIIDGACFENVKQTVVIGIREGRD